MMSLPFLSFVLLGYIYNLSLQDMNHKALKAGQSQSVTIFLAGDVMTGRGIDQALPYSCDPEIFESYVKNAKDYLYLAERANGSIDQPVSMEYIWGDGLAELQQRKPDLKIINLETSITSSDQFWKEKGINYRMHPRNIGCIRTADIDFCALANNHVLDWDYEGLSETLETLKKANIATSGAGMDLKEAQKPAIFKLDNKSRILVFSVGFPDSGIPRKWAAASNKPGVFLVKDYSEQSFQVIQKALENHTKDYDLIIVSVHWGKNWGYDVPDVRRKFAYQLIDEAGVDLVHGHSSHHPLGLEVYQGKLIIYGAGDLINDYEGIRGHEEYRNDLSFMYFAELDALTGELQQLEMVPMKMQKFRLTYPDDADIRHLKRVIDKEGTKFGTETILKDRGTMVLNW
jgi:poly-gamma-glutamate synthesis protein (capsule biosynthesis protein)